MKKLINWTLRIEYDMLKFQIRFSIFKISLDLRDVIGNINMIAHEDISSIRERLEFTDIQADKSNNMEPLN